MPMLYTITASLLGTLEIVDTLMLWSRGRFLGYNEFDPRRLASFHKAPPTLQSDLQFLADWVGYTKLLVAVGFFVSAYSKDSQVRLVAATSYCACMSLAFVRMVPSMRRTAELEEIDQDAPNLFKSITRIVMCALGAGALLEYRFVRNKSSGVA